MKLIDADAFDAVLVDAQKKAKNNFQYGFLSSVRANLEDMPEAEAYTEAKKRIENMEKIIEDQQERIDIMAADMSGWTFFKFRPMTDEEKEAYDMQDNKQAQIIENCPEDGEEVILYTPWGMSIDTFHSDIDFCYFDNHDDVEEGWAWMPTPKPPKEGEQSCQ